MCIIAYLVIGSLIYAVLNELKLSGLKEINDPAGEY